MAEEPVADAPVTDRSWLGFVAVGTGLAALILPILAPLPLGLAVAALWRDTRGPGRTAAWVGGALGVVALLVWGWLGYSWRQSVGTID
ncbi:hypothetical protein [Demequina sp. NBRC 110057]|uniref:hypothetical protein n=1 Tax=Demequina sp. NBRC 110057 TaxID=1570346 RepID=UPI0011782744|nr:hypothetical protein [Demequina sp. NBRC 110057]